MNASDEMNASAERSVRLIFGPFFAVIASVSIGPASASAFAIRKLRMPFNAIPTAKAVPINVGPFTVRVPIARSDRVKPMIVIVAPSERERAVPIPSETPRTLRINAAESTARAAATRFTIVDVGA